MYFKEENVDDHSIIVAGGFVNEAKDDHFVKNENDGLVIGVKDGFAIELAINVNSVFDSNGDQSMIYVDSGNICIFTFNISLSFFSLIPNIDLVSSHLLVSATGTSGAINIWKNYEVTKDP